jgi:hypothetical protein
MEAVPSPSESGASSAPPLPQPDAKTELELTVDYSLVIVEDVLEGEDEDEDEVDEAAPSKAARTPSLSSARQVLGPNADGGVTREVSLGRSSSLFPLATPFLPTKQFSGCSKALQWMEDSSDSDFDCASPVA